MIVNRAGASFLAEITSLGIPSILIPSPNVTNNHQEANARTLEKGGPHSRCWRELTGKGLYEAIAGIMNDESGRKQMAEASRKLETGRGKSASKRNQASSCKAVTGVPDSWAIVTHQTGLT